MPKYVIFTARNSSCGKIMFLQVCARGCVYPSMQLAFHSPPPLHAVTKRAVSILQECCSCSNWCLAHTDTLVYLQSGNISFALTVKCAITLSESESFNLFRCSIWTFNWFLHEPIWKWYRFPSNIKKNNNKYLSQIEVLIFIWKLWEFSRWTVEIHVTRSKRR